MTSNIGAEDIVKEKLDFLEKMLKMITKKLSVNFSVLSLEIGLDSI